MVKDVKKTAWPFSKGSWLEWQFQSPFPFHLLSWCDNQGPEVNCEERNRLSWEEALYQFFCQRKFVSEGMQLFLYFENFCPCTIETQKRTEMLWA